MLADIEHVKKLFQELLKILQIENDNETQYIIRELTIGIQIIDDHLKSTKRNDNPDNLLAELERIYIKINQPRVGLSDYFIWRENFEERIEVNERLDEIKHQLKLMLG